MFGSNFNDLQKFINDLCKLLLFFHPGPLRRFNLNTPPPKDFGHVAHPDAEASGSPRPATPTDWELTLRCQQPVVIWTATTPTASGHYAADQVGAGMELLSWSIAPRTDKP